MQNITLKTYHILEICLKYLSLIPLLLLSFLTLKYQNNISFDILETSTISPNGLRFFLFLLISVILLYLIYIVLHRISENILFTICTLLYMFFGIYLITHIQMGLRYDSGICYWNALNFVTGNFTNLQFGEYFYQYPHQMGLVSYNCILIAISDNPNFIYYVNLFWILLTNFFLWKCSKLVFPESPLTRKVVLLMSFCFLPQLFYLFYAYGQVPGMAFLMIALFFTLKTLKTEKVIYIFLSMPFLACACLVRQNYLIGGIALIILYLLYFLKKAKAYYPIAAIGLLCSMIIPGSLLNSFYEKAADTNLDNAIPSISYIAMGLQENEEPWRAAGWFNSYNTNIYQANNCDPTICTEIAISNISERLQTFVQAPNYAIDFFGEKIITTWCEPTYQSIWSGPLISLNNTTDVPWLHNLYSGNSYFQLLSTLMNVVVVFLFVFSLFNVVHKTFLIKESLTPLEVFCLLFFIGGFLFHLLWETKSQYVYPYILFLPPLAGNGINLLFQKFKGNPQTTN